MFLKYFRRHVHESAYLFRHPFINQACIAKVYKFDMQTRLLNKNVVQLYVPVAHVMLVTVVNSQEQLPYHKGHFFLRVFPLLSCL